MRLNFNHLPDRVAVVGSRVFPHPYPVRRFVENLRERTTVISGGADGVDSWAVRAAEARGLDVKTFWPDKSLSIPERFFARNTLIAEDADIVFAFTAPSPTNGAMDTVRKAASLGKPAVRFHWNLAEWEVDTFNMSEDLWKE